MARTFDAVDATGKVVTGAAIIGASVPRIDGPLKTTGSAQYAADFHFANLAHAVPVQSTIASGTIRTLDTSKAEKMPGILLVLHHGNIGPIPVYRAPLQDWGSVDLALKGAAEGSYGWCEDHNAPTGTGASPYAINSTNGRRVSTNDGYLLTRHR